MQTLVIYFYYSWWKEYESIFEFDFPYLEWNPKIETPFSIPFLIQELFVDEAANYSLSFLLFLDQIIQSRSEFNFYNYHEGPFQK